MNGVAAEYLSNPEDELNTKPEPDVAVGNTPLRLVEFDPMAADGADATNPERDGKPKTESQRAARTRTGLQRRKLSGIGKGSAS